MRGQTMLKIDKGIKVPPPPSRGPKKKYPFDDMVVGDSTFETIGGSTAKKVLAKMRVSASKRLGPGCYACRKDTTDGVDGVRVWRTE